eukprot:20534-Eustigmatos_ZCMA.PRE.1
MTATRHQHEPQGCPCSAAASPHAVQLRPQSCIGGAVPTYNSPSKRPPQPTNAPVMVGRHTRAIHTVNMSAA